MRADWPRTEEFIKQWQLQVANERFATTHNLRMDKQPLVLHPLPDSHTRVFFVTFASRRAVPLHTPADMWLLTLSSSALRAERASRTPTANRGPSGGVRRQSPIGPCRLKASKRVGQPLFRHSWQGANMTLWGWRIPGRLWRASHSPNTPRCEGCHTRF